MLKIPLIELRADVCCCLTVDLMMEFGLELENVAENEVQLLCNDNYLSVTWLNETIPGECSPVDFLHRHAKINPLIHFHSPCPR